jgi:hypothetical protein
MWGKSRARKGPASGDGAAEWPFARRGIHTIKFRLSGGVPSRWLARDFLFRGKSPIDGKTANARANSSAPATPGKARAGSGTARCHAASGVARPESSKGVAWQPVAGESLRRLEPGRNFQFPISGRVARPESSKGVAWQRGNWKSENGGWVAVGWQVGRDDYFWGAGGGRSSDLFMVSAQRHGEAPGGFARKWGWFSPRENESWKSEIGKL